MTRKILAGLLAVFLTLGMVSQAFAQDLPYYFQVDKTVVNAYWNSDGSLSLDYTWVFTNLPGSHPIDFVDVGMPNSNFDMDTIRASVDGVPVSVSKSDYAGNGSGFAIVMGGKTIAAGDSATVFVTVSQVTNVLFPDNNDTNYASASFYPTWFGSQYISGTTDYTVTFHLPSGVQPEEPRWHASPSGFPSEPEAGFDDAGNIIYTWYSPNARSTSSMAFGASFPKSYVPAESIYTPPPAPLIDEDTASAIFMICCFGFIFVGLPSLTALGSRRRKMQYLPPKISIEGHGIKRGLTAVEAALLLEQPLDKVMTMILFGVIKKNAATVKTRDPLELDINDPLMKEEKDLHDYEKNFLRAFLQPSGRERQGELQSMMVALVRTVSEKMKGFSRKETVDYYRSITEKAWAMVEAADTPEVKSQKYEEALEWTMLDKDYDDRTRRVFRGPVIVPSWWGHYDPTYRPMTPSSQSNFPSLGQPSMPAGGSAPLPGADFAAKVVTGVQTFSEKVVGNINTFTEKVTSTTNPLPKPSSTVRSGSRGGGGRSGGCACACACACAGCACACAGGGR
ncbi:MAG TPA: hypothetical protein PKL78_14935 [Anaerolineales bacterium]|nr:hypothetical protein [Anaerolineales bacterium]HNO31124.1 hypothetical protein [Anaerolineales bacterium]